MSDTYKIIEREEEDVVLLSIDREVVPLLYPDWTNDRLASSCILLIHVPAP